MSRFLEGAPVKLHFARARLKARLDGEREADMEFRLDLGSVPAERLPTAVVEAQGLLMTTSAERIDLNEEFSGLNLLMRNLETDEAVQFIPERTVRKLGLRKDAVTGIVELRFVVGVAIDAAIGPWMLEHFGYAVWCVFELSQRELPGMTATAAAADPVLRVGLMEVPGKKGKKGRVQ